MKKFLALFLLPVLALAQNTTLQITPTGSGSPNRLTSSSSTIIVPSGGSIKADAGGSITATSTLWSGFIGIPSPTFSATGDATFAPTLSANGSVTAALILASVISASTVGTSTAIPVITYDAKGRITGVSTATITAPAGALTGTALASNVVTSSLTTVGVLTSGATSTGFTVALDTSTITGTLGLTNGGNGLASAALGDLRYGSGVNTLAALTGNTSATMAVLTQTGNGTVSAPPVWASTIGTGNVVRAISPTLVTPTLGVATATTLNGNTFTTGTGTLTFGAGKTLTQSNTLTFTGTDGSSVNFGAGGTVLYSGGVYVSSLTGTSNQITVSAATGAVTLSLPSVLTLPGTLGVSSAVGIGTVAEPTSSGLVINTTVSGSGIGSHGIRNASTLNANTGIAMASRDQTTLNATANNDILASFWSGPVIATSTFTGVDYYAYRAIHPTTTGTPGPTEYAFTADTGFSYAFYSPGSGKVLIGDTSTATSSSSGAFVVGVNVGLSGNTGGASFLGGDLYLPTNTAGLWLGANSTTTGVYSSSGELRLRTNAADQVKINASTGAVTLTNNLTVSGTGTSTIAGALGLLSANSGLRVEGAIVPTGSAGAGAELGYSSGSTTAFVQGFNRTSSAYTPLGIYGSTITLGVNSTQGTTVAGALTVSSNNGVSIGSTAGQFWVSGGNILLDAASAADMVMRTNGTVFLRLVNASSYVYVPLATASTTTTSGAFQVVGGVGIGGAVNIGGAFSAVGNLVAGTTSGGVTGLLTLGNGVAGNSAVQLRGGSGQKAWQIGSSINNASSLEFSPSTANGGLTFSATVWRLDSSGNVVQSGNITANNTLFTTTGQVGINNASPSAGYVLDIRNSGTTGGVQIAGAFTSITSLNLAATQTTSSGFAVGTWVRNTFNASANSDNISSFDVGSSVNTSPTGTGYTGISYQGLFINTPTFTGTGTVATNYGIKIANQSGATTNYAIQTGTGLVNFGDYVGCLSTLGVGGQANVSSALLVYGQGGVPVTTGVSQVGVNSQPTFSTGATTSGEAMVSVVQTQNGGSPWTMATARGLHILNALKGGSNSTITSQEGLRIDNMTAGSSSNYAIVTGTGQVSFGDNAASTSVSTGAVVITSGGLGVSGQGTFGGVLYTGVSGTAQGQLNILGGPSVSTYHSWQVGADATAPGFYIYDITSTRYILTATAATGSVAIPATATSTSATTGAFVLGSNVGLSGNAGGPNYFAGRLVTTGGIPSVTSGQGAVGGDTSNGIIFSGNGSVNDFTVYNASGVAAMVVPHGTTNTTLVGNLTVSGTGNSPFAGTISVVGNVTAPGLVSLALGDLILGTGTHGTALTLASATGNATFGAAVAITGSLQLGNAYAAGVTTATGTVDIKDSTGTVYHVLVHN